MISKCGSSFVLITVLLFLLQVSYSYGYPEQGKWAFIIQGTSGFKKDETIVVTKSLFKGGKIVVKMICEPESQNGVDFSLNVTWYLRKASCWKEYYEAEPGNYSPTFVFDTLEREGLETANANESSYYVSSSALHACDDKNYYLSSTHKEFVSQSDLVAAKKQLSAKQQIEKENESSLLPINENVKERRKRQESSKSTLVIVGSTDSVTPPSLPTKRGSATVEPLDVVPADGIYQFILGTSVQGLQFHANISYKAYVHIEMYNDYGYLSAADYPLLLFYSTMCVIYVIYGVGWLVVSFMRWRELLRVQYWIGAVILLGMLEKAVFTAEYESVNKRGTSIPGLIVFAELVSCAKRTLSRMLVIIVSFGFGIVKPRLGIVLHRVVGVGILYFILASIEGCMRALRPKISNDDYSRRLLFAIIPLALLESAICWWVFSALVSTTRTLRLRRNTIKLSLFRHFTNTLIFAVVTSVIFMLWSIKYQNYDACLSDWKQLWVNDAFWHVLFAIILLVIMILWRPTNNNQRFAFSPLLDEVSEGEEEEQVKLMADVSDTMKLRNSKASTSSSPRESRSVEEDLKWLEENIPQSFTDTGLPVMDSDEEILTTKFEISKMQ